MSTRHLRNISIAQFQSFLDLIHCKFIRINGGHEVWFRRDLRRPIVFPTHTDPVPEFIIKNNLRILEISKNDFFDILESKKEVCKQTFKISNS